jgi:hypothetical protein
VSVQFTAAATAFAAVGHLVRLPAQATVGCMVIYMLCAYAGVGFAVAALILRRWWALGPALVCAVYLTVQWYWLFEWIK